MKRTWTLVVVAIAIAGALPVLTVLAQEHEPAPRGDRGPAGLDLNRLRFRVTSDEARLAEDVQVLTGHVRVEVLGEDERALLTVRADRAERAGERLVVSGEVRVEAPEGVGRRARAAGLDRYLRANGISLGKTVLRAKRVVLDQRARTIEIEALQAEARAESERRGRPRVSLRAERVRLVLREDRTWDTRVSRPTVGFQLGR